MGPGTYAARTPDKPVVVMADGSAITYARFEALTNQLAHLFRNQGLERGDHVAFVLENRPELLAVIWAAQRSGLYYTACSTRLKAEELEHIVDDCGARLLIASDKTFDVADAISAPRVERRLLIGTPDPSDPPPSNPAPGWTAFGEAVRSFPTTPIDDESEGVDMLYSSGTTGRPKGVKLPLPTKPYPAPVGSLERMLGIDDTTVFLSPAPLYHTAPLRFARSIPRSGGTLVIEERFDPEELLALIERHRVTIAQLVPTMFIRLLRLDESVRHRYDLSSLQVVLHAAAPCPIDVKRSMIEWWGPIVHEYYSSTEASGFVYCNSEEWLAHPGTVGRSLLGPVHILDDDGNELPPHQAGSVYFEGRRFEYHGDPGKTEGTGDPQGRGWTTVGDVGYLDEDGYLFLTDRKAFMIISGGVNIYPQETENVLSSHPAVADVAVFGIPDDDMGERVHAVVQPAPGVVGTDALAEELITHCRATIAHFKCPRSIDFRDELPRHETGKLYKGQLKAEYWSGVSPRP